jgi:xanthosine utilization system XapX-like protein
MGCGCLALAVGLILGIIFFIYASTDPGPPIEGVILLAWLATIVGNRTLGVPSRLRTDPD